MSGPEGFWVPSELEKKCLDHLDHADNWTILHEERPTEELELPWRPFRRIWWINFAQYFVILGLLFAGLESTVVSSWSDAVPDLPGGIAGVIFLAGALAAYVTHLYRRSWNRRARYLRRSV